jgi:lysophospholipase L1-like esterase
MVGINDLKHKSPIPKIITNYKNILNTIKEESSGTKIFIQSVLPVNNKLFYKAWNRTIDNAHVIHLNKELFALAKELNINFINLFSLFTAENNELNPLYTYDGIHLNGKGYLVWKSAVDQYVGINILES